MGDRSHLVCIYMDLRNISYLISTSNHHLESEGSKQKCSTDQNTHPRRGLGVALCIASHSQQSWFIYMHSVQCILDCIPVFVSTEPVCRDDQVAHSCSNPYKPQHANCIFQWSEWYLTVQIFLKKVFLKRTCMVLRKKKGFFSQFSPSQTYLCRTKFHHSHFDYPY